MGRLEKFSKCDELAKALKSSVPSLVEVESWFSHSVASGLQAAIAAVKV